MKPIVVPDELVIAMMLVFARSAALMLALPAMLGVAVPVRVRLLFAALLAGVLAAASPTRLPSAAYNAALAYLMLKEIALGLMLAFSASVVMAAVGLAGEMIGSQIELSAAEILRAPLPVSVLSDSLMALAAFLFFGAGLQRPLIYALARSLQVLPIGSTALPDPSGLIRAAGAIFGLGVAIALPLLIPLLMLALAQGALSRFAPQINLLVAAPAAMILAGFSLILLNASGLTLRIDRAWTEGMLQMIRTING